jgi:hypothetical protein
MTFRPNQTQSNQMKPWMSWNHCNRGATGNQNRFFMSAFFWRIGDARLPVLGCTETALTESVRIVVDSAPCRRFPDSWPFLTHLGRQTPLRINGLEIGSDGRVSPYRQIRATVRKSQWISGA